MKNTIVFILTLFFLSCTSGNEDLTTCGTNNPLEDIAWLKELKEGVEMSASPAKAIFIQYTYNDKTVFSIDTCADCTDNLIKVYNCDKEVICEFGGIEGLNTCPDFEQKATNKLILWEN